MHQNKKKSKPSPRHLSRSIAVQGIYSFQITQASVAEIEDFLYNQNPDKFQKANYELMHYLLSSSISNFDNMLNQYAPYATRSLNEINMVEKAILVVAAVELNHSLTVPATVIINEAVEIAKLYGAEDSFKFINNIIDKLANKIRINEFKSDIKISNTINN